MLKSVFFLLTGIGFLAVGYPVISAACGLLTLFELYRSDP